MGLRIREFMHAWVGGILPSSQGKGYFSEFYDWLITFAEVNGYKSITGNTDNYKSNIIRMMLKKGFYITTVKEGQYGDGIKICMKYDIYPPRSLRISLTTACNLKCFFCHHEGIVEENSQITIPEIERILTQARRLRVNEITLTGGEPTVVFEKMLFVLKYCGSWDRKPHIKIVTNGSLWTPEMINELNYKGKLTVNLSVHSIDVEKNRCIVGETIDKSIYDGVISGIKRKKIDLRINSTILKGINSNKQSLSDIIKFSIDNNVDRVNLMELLVTKKQYELQKYYMSFENIDYELNCALMEFGDYEIVQSSNKKKTYRLSSFGKKIDISIYRLSCRCGCENCNENNDITISATAKAHPCYLEPEIVVGDAIVSLEKTINECDVFIKNKDKNFSRNILYWG